MEQQYLLACGLSKVLKVLGTNDVNNSILAKLVYSTGIQFCETAILALFLDYFRS